MSITLKPAVGEHDHMQGNPNAIIELVEYGDYQCPHCGRAYGIIKMIQQELGDDMKFVFRNFPLAEIHPDATNAAIATEAAALQGRFWEMHDIIFENQYEMGPEDIIGYAKAIGLGLAQFKKDMQQETLAAKVENDFESGVRSGVNATPTFFINGEKFNDGWESPKFIKAIKEKMGQPKV